MGEDPFRQMRRRVVGGCSREFRAACEDTIVALRRAAAGAKSLLSSDHFPTRCAMLRKAHTTLRAETRASRIIVIAVRTPQHRYYPKREFDNPRVVGARWQALRAALKIG